MEMREKCYKGTTTVEYNANQKVARAGFEHLLLRGKGSVGKLNTSDTCQGLSWTVLSVLTGGGSLEFQVEVFHIICCLIVLTGGAGELNLGPSVYKADDLPLSHGFTPKLREVKAAC